MKISLRKRITSFLTASVMTATSLTLTQLTATALPAGTGNAEPVTSGFSLDQEALKTGEGPDGNAQYISAANVYANIAFTDSNDQAVAVTLPDNTYYLLVEGTGTQRMGLQSKDVTGTKLIELGVADASSWASKAGDLNAFQSTGGIWGPGMGAQVTPTSLKGTLLLNDDPSVELTEANAVDRKDTLATSSIKATVDGKTKVFDVDTAESLTAKTGPGANNNTAEIHAKSADERTLQINILRYDEKTKTTVSPTTGKKYYVYSYLVDKGESPTRENAKGYLFKQFDPETDETTEIKYKYGSDFRAASNDSGNTNESTIAFDPEQYDIYYRVYLSNEDLSSDLQIANLEQSGADNIPGFRANAVQRQGNTDVVNFVKDSVGYEVKTIPDGITFTDADRLYVFVQVKHATSSDTYALAPYDGSTLIFQDADTASWGDQNGNIINGERITGNETVIIKLLQRNANQNTLSISNAQQLSGCIEIKDGDIIKGYTVNIPGQEREAVADLENETTMLTDYIKFTPLSVENEYDYLSILGDAVEFGITAQNFNQTNHLETNYAAINFSNPENINADPDFSRLEGSDEKFGGHFYVANFVNDSDKLRLGGNSFDAVIHVPDKSHIQATGIEGGHGQDHYTIVEESADLITAKITPMLDHMKQISNELASKSINAKTIDIGGNKCELDTTGYPDDATIYVNADEIASYFKGSEGVTVKKLPDQTIVFNFTNTDSVELASIKYVLPDGNVSITNDESGESDEVARHIVYNLNSCKNVKIDGATGIFLIPQPDSDAVLGGTSRGWMVTGGTFHNDGGEWHYAYQELKKELDYISFSKVDITDGKTEIAGATLTIVPMDDTVDLTAAGITVKQGSTDLTDSAVTANKIEFVTNGKVNVKVTGLPDGKYKLTETGDNFTNDKGDTFTVIPGEFIFEVKDGAIISKTEKDEEGNNVTTNFTGESAASYDTVQTGVPGYYATTGQSVVVGDGKYITVSKIDIVNQQEIAGAHIEIIYDDYTMGMWGTGGKNLSNVVVKQGDKTITNAGGRAWNSTLRFDSDGINPVKIGNLPDGNYTIKETGETFIGSDGKEYSVISSTASFVVKNGLIVSKTEADSTKDFITDGYEILGTEPDYYFTDAATIVVGDAEVLGEEKTITVSKKITGAADEVAGAQFKLTGVNDEGQSIDLTNIPVRKATIDERSADYIVWTSTGEAAEIINLPNGTYTLEEKVAPDGCTVVSAFEFKVEDGKVTLVNAETTGVTTTDGNDGLIITDDISTISISKKAVSGEDELAGAEITLSISSAFKDNNGDNEITLDDADFENVKVLRGTEDITSDALNIIEKTITYVSGDSPVTIKGLPDGVYSLAETGGEFTVGEGDEAVTYSVVDSVLSFTIREGVITTLDAEAKSENNDSIAKVTSATTIEISDAEKVEEKPVIISKKVVGGGEEAPDAVFELTGVTGEGDEETPILFTNVTVENASESKVSTDEKTLSWTSGDTAAEFSGLPAGTYTLEEKAAPDGYQVVSIFKFKIDDEGNVTLLTSETTGGTVTAEDGTITITDDISDIKISKNAVNGESELPGAEITITLDKPAKDGKTLEGNITVLQGKTDITDASVNGNVIKYTSASDAVEIKGLPDGEYTLKETGGEFVNDGTVYTVIDSEFKFTVNNGVISESTKVTDDNGTIESTDDSTIKISDAKTKTVTISKKAVGGEDELPGASLKLTLTKPAEGVTDLSKTFDKDLSSDKMSIEWKSTDNAKVISNLPDGTYELRETGDDFTVGEITYSVIESTLTFEVKGGEITAVQKITDEATGGTMEINDASTITVSDAEAIEAAPVVISKSAVTNGKSENLAGAILVVEYKGNDDIDLSEVAIKGLTKSTDGKLTADTFVVDEEAKTVTFISGAEDSELSGLPAGKYELIEDTAPLGYAKTTSIPFNLEKDGTVKVNDKALEVLDLTDKVIEAAISKVEIAGEGTAELKGAKLTLTNLDGTSLEDVKVTLGKGSDETKLEQSENKISFISGTTDTVLSKLPAGKYSLEEIQTPGDEYNKAETITFTIDEYGKITDVKNASSVEETKENDETVGGK
ncbi:MAG: hypothetical protein J5501_07430, partial [Ruminococcus sp.]|nr:hypothetical protein [Ruminococcus sp.]